jgi:DNA-binding MarR family transcriptional regulator
MGHRQDEPTIEESCIAEGYSGALIACPDFVLSTLAMSINQLVEQAIEPLGLHVRTYRLLRMLLVDGRQRQSAIGAALGTDRTTVVGLIDELEAVGAVKRERDANDRRSYDVVLTARGKRLATTAIGRVSAAEATMFGPLSSGEKRDLQTLATRLLAERGPIADRARDEYLAPRRRDRRAVT